MPQCTHTQHYKKKLKKNKKERKKGRKEGRKRKKERKKKKGTNIKIFSGIIIVLNNEFELSYISSFIFKCLFRSFLMISP
jgi:hypothetical protein